MMSRIAATIMNRSNCEYVESFPLARAFSTAKGPGGHDGVLIDYGRAHAGSL
jgi:hypothetical protein